MFNYLKNIQSLQELKNRVLFLLLGIIVYRFGAHIPIPGVDAQKLFELLQKQQNNILGLFNFFSGGALLRVSVFALGIMPYISASIIIQLFSSVSPKLEQLKKEGEQGRRKINQYTRFFTLLLSIIQAFGMTKFFLASGIAIYSGFTFYLIIVLSFVTGTMFLMWLGEQITERGIGNGISLIIFTGILAGLLPALARTMEQIREGEINPFSAIIIVLLVAGVIYFVVFVEKAQRKIAVYYANRQHSKKFNTSQSTHLPLKINMSGVIPPIFASSIILFPATLAQWFGNSTHLQWLTKISLMLSQGQPLHIIIFSIGILFFSFFFTALVFNPKETSDNLKKSGAFIPGLRPGDQTAKYIDEVMTRLTLIGSIYVILVCLLPEFMNLYWHVPFYFGGTSLLIIVVVTIDFIAQVQAYLLSQQYSSFFKKSK